VKAPFVGGSFLLFDQIRIYPFMDQWPVARVVLQKIPKSISRGITWLITAYINYKKIYNFEH